MTGHVGLVRLAARPTHPHGRVRVAANLVRHAARTIRPQGVVRVVNLAESRRFHSFDFNVTSSVPFQVLGMLGQGYSMWIVEKRWLP